MPSRMQLSNGTTLALLHWFLNCDCSSSGLVELGVPAEQPRGPRSEHSPAWQVYSLENMSQSVSDSHWSRLVSNSRLHAVISVASIPRPSTARLQRDNPSSFLSE